MKSVVSVYITRDELLALARQHSDTGDAIPDNVRTEVMLSPGKYSAVADVERYPVRLIYEIDSEAL